MNEDQVWVLIIAGISLIAFVIWNICDWGDNEDLSRITNELSEVNDALTAAGYPDADTDGDLSYAECIKEMADEIERLKAASDAFEQIKRVVISKIA